VRTIWGRGEIEDILRSEAFGVQVRYSISPASFYQVNPVQTEKIYQKVLELADLSGTETVMDLYCGIGTISLFLAAKAEKVIGVEIVPEAIEDAKKNAAMNGIKNAEFYVGKAEEVVPALYAKGAKADVVVVDPPRKGCDQKLLDTILQMDPGRLVYVSCDPATLARDLKFLTANGYELKYVQPYDQFCHTVHVETIVVLSKGIDISAGKIQVEFSVEDMDLSAAHGNASYNKIKKYIYEKTGLQVSNLNIAQVKRKYGIIERENYNLPKSENSKQPNCTPEKEKAIVAALQYFKMIG
jgi:23S rRNA (uracil1939-C5)-methyltransferase